ncbi:MAG: histidine--tRNA ligase [Granulosicoccaceae bacterium]
MNIKSLRGMHDLLPADIAPWQALESRLRDLMQAYGYAEMRTPLLERTDLFCRSIGDATDIVEKEMYAFPDRHGESIALRPENTASCVRAALQHGLMRSGAQRIWYMGPMFRYERPQKGRYRQFHQVGAEVYGVAGALVEVELMLLSARLWKALGMSDAVRLEINTLGTDADRANYREKLVQYFNDHREQLDEDSQRRLGSNPLRILDSKNPEMQALIEAAPKLRENLGDEAQAHFAQLQEGLNSAGVDFTINPRLVRGLDYYSHTVFEWVTDHLGAQGTVCAGGRYDGLVTQIGGPETPAVGWAMGMERLLVLLEELVGAEQALPAHAYLVAMGDTAQMAALGLSERLRDAVPSLRLTTNVSGGNAKAQFKKADRSGAAVALVIGEQELTDGSFSLKPLRGDGEQQTLSFAQTVEQLTALTEKD